MANIVDARGKACPQPVIDTKNALKEHGAPIITLVDNDIARQNIEKMVAQMGLTAASDTLEDGTLRIVVQPVSTDFFAASTIGAIGEKEEIAQLLQAEAKMPDGKAVVVLSSACMGTGDDTLGAALMKGFVYALTQLDYAPDTVLLYNGGAKLSAEGAETVADLTILAENGTEVLTCGTCLSHFGLTDKLAVGEVTNMYVIAEVLSAAARVIRP